jgi:G:T-mismatch repair DNA endonuclease (very short patch repair protein)
MKMKEAKEKSDAIIQELFPGVDYSFSSSTNHKLKVINDEKEFREKVIYHINQVKILNNNPIYWYILGFRGEDIKKNIILKPKQCKICSVFYYNKKTVTCSDECNKISRETGYKRLSQSRKKYNPRDPVQYAQRHNISIDEATKIVQSFINESSILRLEYWIKNGYTYEEAKQKISYLQSRNSKRSIEYWIKMGYTLEEAKIKVSEHQRQLAMEHHLKNMEDVKNGKYSFWSKTYWIDRAYTDEEANGIISEKQRENALKYIQNNSPEERRKNNHLCLEYWEKRFPENDITMYQEYLSDINGSKSFRSNIADELFKSLISDLSKDYISKYIHTIDNEYCIVSKERNKTHMYDFVDKHKKICIEFNGDYWHANPQKYNENDVITFSKDKVRLAKDIWADDYSKLSLIESERGYKTIVVWECDYKKDKEAVIKKLKDELGYK